MKKTVLLVLILTVTSGLFSQSLILKFAPPVETKYSTEFDIVSTVNQVIMGIEQAVEVNMLMLINSKIIESTSEYSLIELSYKRFSIKTSNAMVSFVIDSHIKDDNPANSIFKSLIDKIFYIKIDKAGEVIDIEGLDQIISEIIKGVNPDDPLIESYRKTLNENFGANSLKQNFQHFSALFPDYSVGVGDSWNFNLNSKATEFDTQIFNTATIKSISSNNVIIQINSIIVSSGDNSMEIQGMKGHIEMTGSQVSEIQINPISGLTKSGVVTQKIEGELKLSSIENNEEEFLIPMIISSKIQITNTIIK